MYARVSTFRTRPGSEPGGLAESTVSQLLELPGCRGVYFMTGTESDTVLGITMWDSDADMAASRATANRLRKEAGEAERMEVIGVEEFEIGTATLQD